MFQDGFVSVVHQVIGPVVLIAIYEGARRLRLSGIKKSAIVPLMLGGVFASIFSALPAYVAYQIDSLAIGMDQSQTDQIETMPIDWGSNMSP